MKSMKVFVSSTSKDLKEYREAARDAIIGHENIPIMMEYIIPEGKPPIKECAKKIKESDLFIGIYAYRYGFMHPKAKISITEQEYEYAVKKKKRIFCFMLPDEKGEYPEKYNKEDDENKPELQKKFRGKILKDNYIKFCKNPDELKYHIAAALDRPPEADFHEAIKDAQIETEDINAEKKIEDY